MASTDAKSGFRLPWSSDRNESDEPAATTVAEATSVDAVEPQTESETPTMIDPATTTSGETLQDAPPAPEAAAPVAEPEATAAPEAELSPAPAPARKPNKFMADLTKAMQAAAEGARTDSLERFRNEAKTHIESIHASTADQSVSLRKRADDDIAGIREWSKAEIARIREETDERVTHRKDVLEREIEAHAAEIEHRIEKVQARVTSFEAEMATFFERLLAENDPTRFASMAEHLPEPPPFDADAAWDSRPVVETPTAVEATSAPEPAEADVRVELTEGTPVAEAVAVDAPPQDGVTTESSAADSEPVEAVTGETDVAAAAEPTSPDNGDLFGISSDEPAPVVEDDPRLAALGVEQAEAAEAEAAELPSDGSTDEEEIPTIAEDALAARLAGLVAEEHPAAPADGATTRVIVTGLVSVASIAGFKRNLARVNGVRSVGVSSGPDGEFVFAVHHDTELALAEGITMLPGFGARVTNEAPGELTVAARDPESDG